MTPPPRFSQEDLMVLFGTTEIPKIGDKEPSEEAILQMMKNASIKANFSSLGIENFEEKAREHYVEPSGKSAITIPPRDIFVGADLHGCDSDLNGILKTYFHYLFNGEDVHLVLLGDYIHGLQALKIDGVKEIPIGPAYPDKSLDIILKVIELRDLLGDRFVPLIGDHDLSLVFPEFSIFKHGINQTKEFSDKLTEEQKKYLKAKVSKFPVAARTQNHCILAHAGIPPMVESWKQLENLKLSAPLSDRLEWANETIEGRLFMGKYDKIKDKMIRVISAEDNKKGLKRLDAKLLYTGHSGKASFYFEKDGKRVMYHGAPGFIFNKGNQAVLVTTEGNGDEKVRDEKGTNNYGKQYAIESGGECGKILHAEIGSELFKSYPLDFEELEESEPSLISPPPITDNPLIEKIISQAEVITKRGGFDEGLYNNLLKNKGELKNLEQSVLEKILSHFVGTKDSGLPKGILPHSYYLKPLPEKAHGIFLGSGSKK